MNHRNRKDLQRKMSQKLCVKAKPNIVPTKCVWERERKSEQKKRAQSSVNEEMLSAMPTLISREFFDFLPSSKARHIIISRSFFFGDVQRTEVQYICLWNYHTCMAWNRCARIPRNMNWITININDFGRLRIKLYQCNDWIWKDIMNTQTRREPADKHAFRNKLARQTREREEKRKTPNWHRTTRQFRLDDFSHYFFFFGSSNTVREMHKACGEYLILFPAGDKRGLFLATETNSLELRNYNLCDLAFRRVNVLSCTDTTHVARVSCCCLAISISHQRRRCMFKN